MSVSKEVKDYMLLFSQIDTSILDDSSPENIKQHIKVLVNDHMAVMSEQDHEAHGLKDKVTNLVYALRTSMIREIRSSGVVTSRRADEFVDFLHETPSPAIVGHNRVLAFIRSKKKK